MPRTNRPDGAYPKPTGAYPEPTQSRSKNYWTDASIKDLPEVAGKKGKDHVHWHPERHRFGVRFRDGKKVAYVMMFTLGGREHKRTIGKVGGISLTDALKELNKDHAQLAQPVPVNPILERRQGGDAHSDRFDAFIDRFLADQRHKGNTARWVARQGEHLREYFPGLSGVPVKLISRRLISEQLDRIVAGWEHKETGRRRGGKVAMRAARATLETYFNWLISKGVLESNPVEHTTKFKSKERTRWLTPAELRIVWHVAGEDTQWGRIVRLLILTGGRREQIAGLRKRELDKDMAMITLPPKGVREGGSKNDEPFQIPLSPQARRLLAMETSPRGECFFGNGKGDGGFSGYSKAFARLIKAIGDRITTPFTLHDFRRTFVTNMARELKIAPHITDACINHKPEHKQGVAGIYQQDDMLTERVAAMNAWGEWIENLTKEDLKLVA